ncbi:MAG: type II toxin-antitoxin system HicB family antitoxin [Ignavibacteriota bacterium]
MEYAKLIYPSPEGGFVGEVPQLAGCLAQGETEMECLEELEKVEELWLASAKANNMILPETGNFIERLRVAVNG